MEVGSLTFEDEKKNVPTFGPELPSGQRKNRKKKLENAGRTRKRKERTMKTERGTTSEARLGHTEGPGGDKGEKLTRRKLLPSG